MARIIVQGVTCEYDSRSVLRDVALEVAEGETLALIGPNGAGKTTLLRALSRVLRPKRGVVLLDGRDLWHYSMKDVAREMAFVPQESRIDWAYTVEESVLMGRMPHLGWLQREGQRDREAATEAMSLTGTMPLRTRLVTELSGGERQRAVIARALAQESQVLLLDEPTSNLDLKYQAEILELVCTLQRQKGLTVIMALHDLNYAALYADAFALLNEGKLFALGTPAEVLTKYNLETAYGTEVFVGRHPVYGTPFAVPLPRRRSNLALPEAPTVHVIGGGGTAGPLLEQLADSGFRLTAGVLNLGDSDWTKARTLGAEVAKEAPFSAISPESDAANRVLLAKADAVALSDTYFGRGNLRNLSALLEVAEQGKPVVVCAHIPGERWDYAEGEAEALLQELISLPNVRIARGVDQALEAVQDILHGVAGTAPGACGSLPAVMS